MLRGRGTSARLYIDERRCGARVCIIAGAIPSYVARLREDASAR
jgi:hypothetical protein